MTINVGMLRGILAAPTPKTPLSLYGTFSLPAPMAPQSGSIPVTRTTRSRWRRSVKLRRPMSCPSRQKMAKASLTGVAHTGARRKATMITLRHLRGTTAVAVMDPRWRSHAVEEMRSPEMIRWRHRQGYGSSRWTTASLIKAMDRAEVGRMIRGMGGRTGVLGGRTGILGGRSRALGGRTRALTGSAGAIARTTLLGGGTD